MGRKPNKEDTYLDRLSESKLLPSEFVPPEEVVDKYFDSVEELLGKKPVPIDQSQKEDISEFLKEDISRQYLEKAIDTKEFPLPTYWSAYTLYAGGALVSEISKALKVPGPTITSWSMRHNWKESKKKIRSLIQQGLEKAIVKDSVKKALIVADRLEPFIDQLEGLLEGAICELDAKDVLKYYMTMTDAYAQLKGQKVEQKSVTIGVNDVFEELMMNKNAPIPSKDSFKAELVELPKLIE